jgi:acyl-CoA thioesterase
MSTTKALTIVNEMLKHDAFSRWLGIEVLKVAAGSCSLRMQIREEMLNGFKIAHGGITFSLADSALAFASNGGGRKSVSIETSISHLVSLVAGDRIIAEASLETETEKLGHYRVVVFKENDPDKKTVALFKGIVYRTSKNWEISD